MPTSGNKGRRPIANDAKPPKLDFLLIPVTPPAKCPVGFTKSEEEPLFPATSRLSRSVTWSIFSPARTRDPNHRAGKRDDNSSSRLDECYCARLCIYALPSHLNAAQMTNTSPVQSTRRPLYPPSSGVFDSGLLFGDQALHELGPVFFGAINTFVQEHLANLRKSSLFVVRYSL